MLHTRDFELQMSMRLDQDEYDRQGTGDAPRAPRGLILGLGIGAALWLVIIIVIVTLA